MAPLAFVSIVVPTLRRPHLLRDCLTSLGEQTYAGSLYEIIVVADGPQRDVRELVAELPQCADGPAVRYVEIDHRGPNAARNVGISAATGTLVCLVDDDVVAPPTWLERLLAGIGARDGLTCFGGPIRARFEGPAPRTCERCEIRTTRLDEGGLEREVEAVYSANMAMTRTAIEQVGPFDESLPIYGDEEEWEHRLRLAGGAVIYLPEAWLWHRKTAEDLRLARLLRTHLRFGYGEAAYWVATSRPRLAAEARRRASGVPGLIAHAVKRRCWNGIMAGFAGIGFAAGALIHSVSRRVSESRLTAESAATPGGHHAR